MLFAVSMYGEIHKNEARRWFNTLCRAAEQHSESLYALIDLQHVTFIGATARIQFAEATRLPQVKGLLFITREPHMLQAIRMIGMLGKRDSTHAFTSVEDARAFASENVSA